ncbi:MAG: FAD binding domain-containing protein [Chloroflexi bacterium]|nr:FAD binding domain-containing protein [Chloroflexota bacterium]
MKLWEHYHTPTTVDGALALLAQYAGQARVIAGGTDLLVDARAEGGFHPYPALVDITRIPELCAVEEDGDFITVGAGVTHTQIVKSSLLARYATCLVESCGVVGGPQVRNVGTLGGNVAHALPAGDGTTSLVALDAEADIVKDGQPRRVPVQEMFLGPGQSLVDSTRDLLLRFRFHRAADHEATAFKRIMRPQGVALPILGCAVWVRLDENRATFEAARISIAPVGPTPGRAGEVEQALIGQPAADETITRIAELAQSTLHPRTSKYRATADYRREMIGVLVRRTLALAVKRAQTGDIVPEGVGA